MKQVTQAEFARICNVNRSTVNRAIKSGRLEANNGRILVQVATEGPAALEQAVLALWDASGSAQPHHQARLQQINEEKAARQAMKNAINNAAVGNECEDDDTASLSALNLRIKRADAMKRENEARTSEIQRKALEGEYLLREAVAYAMRDHTSTLREKMENLADRLTPIVSPLQTAEETHAAIAEAAEGLLREMHESMLRAMELARESK